MINIIVREFDIEINGKGIFAGQTSSGEVMVPTFGFNKNGEVQPRKIAEMEGCSPLQQEWIDKHIILAAEDFRKAIHQEAFIDGQGHMYDQDEYHRDAIPGEVPVYVAVIKKSDTPNEIGLVSDSSPMSLENSSIIVKNIKTYKLLEE